MKSLFTYIILLMLAAGCGESYNESQVVLKCSTEEAASLIMEEYKSPTQTFSDSLLDVNGDSVSELLVSFYHAAGTGEKYGMFVYFWNSSECKFEKNKELSGLANKSFDGEFIYGFYLGNGGGEAVKYKWIGNSVEKIESYQFEVEFLKDSLQIVRYYKSNNTRDTILCNSIVLPDEYHYASYKPLIEL